MTLQIYRIELSVNGSPIEREKVGEASDLAAADRAVKAIIERYPRNGYSDEHGYWWGRTASGKTQRFIISDGSGPVAPAGSSFALPTINDYIDQIRSKLDDAADHFGQTVRSIENREARRGIGGNLIVAVIDVAREQLESSAILVFRDLRNALARTNLDRQSLRDATVQDLQNFLIKMKSLVGIDKLKGISANPGVSQEIDRRIGDLDRRFALMVRQMDTGLLDLGDDISGRAPAVAPATAVPETIAGRIQATLPSESNILPPAQLPASTSIQFSSRMTADATVMQGQASLHREMLSRIAVLEEMIRVLSPQQDGIGHNNPPEPIEGVSFKDADRQAIEAAVIILKDQPVSPPETAAAEKAAATLNTTGERLWIELARTGAYGADKLDAFITKAAESAGAEFGKRIVQAPFWYALVSALLTVSSAAHTWLASILH